MGHTRRSAQPRSFQIQPQTLCKSDPGYDVLHLAAAGADGEGVLVVGAIFGAEPEVKLLVEAAAADISAKSFSDRLYGGHGYRYSSRIDWNGVYSIPNLWPLGNMFFSSGRKIGPSGLLCLAAPAEGEPADGGCGSLSTGSSIMKKLSEAPLSHGRYSVIGVSNTKKGG